MADFKMDWFGKEVLAKTRIVVAKVSKEVAGDVLEDAKAILKRKAKKTTADGLLSQMDVKKSKFDGGGHIIRCQGPGNWHKPFHASFVELGNVWIHPYGNKSAPKINLPAIPFMRPALRKNKSNANKKFRDALDKL